MNFVFCAVGTAPRPHAYVCGVKAGVIDKLRTLRGANVGLLFSANISPLTELFSIEIQYQYRLRPKRQWRQRRLFPEKVREMCHLFKTKTVCNLRYIPICLLQ